ncbi:MAG: hypothetical protein IT294_16260 [Deltaproteobacteria bacterium]|nr:hypothetical protein [Deltaproteobacteria bacterium]
MLRAPALVFLLVTAATAARAEDGAPGPERWLLERGDAPGFAAWEQRRPAPSADPLSRLVEHCKRNPVGLGRFVTLVPNPPEDGHRAELPTVAIFARAQGRAIVSLTRVRARADEGQEVVMQRTLVSDLLAGRGFSLTVYEDHALSDTAARLMGFGTRLTFRPTGWPVRIEVLGSYDFDAGASAYLSVTGVFAAPPVPAGAAR